MRKNNGFGTTTIERHYVEKIVLYEITENNLTELEKNSVSDLYLEFGIALISIFVSFLCSFFGIDAKTSPHYYYFAIIVCILSGVISIVLLFLWYRTRKNRKDIFKRIRESPVYK